MKTIGLFFILAVAIPASGCYTQLALNNDKAEATVVEQPYPAAIIVEPIFVPIAPPDYPPPAVGVSAPSPVTRPDNTTRNIGSQRGSSGSNAGSRNTSSSRGGR